MLSNFRTIGFKFTPTFIIFIFLQNRKASQVMFIPCSIVHISFFTLFCSWKSSEGNKRNKLQINLFFEPALIELQVSLSSLVISLPTTVFLLVITHIHNSTKNNDYSSLPLTSSDYKSRIPNFALYRLLFYPSKTSRVVYQQVVLTR